MYLFFSTSRYVFIATDHTEVEISLSTIVRHEKSSNFLTLAQSNEINKFYESHFEKNSNDLMLSVWIVDLTECE